MKTVIFLCKANSARSQMAEGIAQSINAGSWKIYSAGSQPTVLNPLAVEAMGEMGIDISHHRAKGLDSVPLSEADLVITLCAAEDCPVIPAGTAHASWVLPDPAAGDGSDSDSLRAFRTVRDELVERISNFRQEGGFLRE